MGNAVNSFVFCYLYNIAENKAITAPLPTDIGDSPLHRPI